MIHLTSWRSRSGLELGSRAAVVVATLLAVGCARPESPSEELPADTDRVVLTAEQMRSMGVRVETVPLTAVSETRDVPALLTSPDTASATVGSVVEGRVASVLVLPGDRVREGQPLLRIHSHELTDAIRDLHASEASLAYAAAAAERSEALLAAGAVSREEVERRTAERSQILAEVERAREWVEHLSPSEEGLVVVTAPREGTVFSVSVTPGAVVLPGAELVSLGRTDVLWAVGWLPERAAVAVRPGDAVEIFLPAVPGVRIGARVIQVGAAVDPVRRAVEVRAEVVDLPEGVRPGMFATMALPVGAEASRVVLPSSAVQRTAEGEIVFVEEEPGVFRAVAVSSVPVSNGRVAVEGLPEDARVVVEGAYAVRSVFDGNSPAGGDS